MPHEVLVPVGPPVRGEHRAALLPAIVPGLTVRQWGGDLGDPPAVRYAAAWAVPDGLVGEMVDYATIAVLALHRDLPQYLPAQRDMRWSPRPVRARRDTRIGVLGLGAIGKTIVRLRQGARVPGRIDRSAGY